MFAIEAWRNHKNTAPYLCGIFGRLNDAGRAIASYRQAERTFVLRSINVETFPLYMIDNGQQLAYTDKKENLIQYVLSGHLGANETVYKLFRIEDFFEADKEGAKRNTAKLIALEKKNLVIANTNLENAHVI